MTGQSPRPRRPSVIGAVTAIARSELLRVSRDRVALFFVVVLPVVLIVLIGAIFGAAARHLPVGLVVEDPEGLAASDPVTRAVVERVRVDESLKLREYTSTDDLERDIRAGTLVAGLFLPAEFGSSVAAGRPAVLRLYVGQSQYGQGMSSVVRSIAEDVGARWAAAAFVHEVAAVGDTTARDIVDQAASGLTPVSVETRTVGRVLRQSDNQYAYTAPSTLVLFVFVNSLAVGAALGESKRLGVARRMLAAPVSPSTVLVGMGLARLAFALIQSAVIVTVSGLLFRVDWGNPAAAGTLIITYALVAAGSGLLIGAIASNPDQGQAIGIPLAIGMGMLGGTMWPLEIVPPLLRTLGHLTPHAWAMDAWLDLIFEGKGISAIWVELVVLSGIAIVLFTVASVMLRRSLTR